MKTLLIIVLVGVYLMTSSCGGCSKSGRLKGVNNPLSSERESSNQPKVDHTFSKKITIKMRKKDGVYMIPVKINGTEMDFIFDTGAGIISISDVEASFLYKQGKITKADILGTGKFQDATGTISEGAIINLKEVSIGGRTIYNVRASVVDNVNAPLLLGQTALEKFGKITIDYQNEEITFQ